MNLEEYQTEAFRLAKYPQRGENQLWYPGLGLMGEYSEALEKWFLGFDVDEELGDFIWYLNAICVEIDLKLSACKTFPVEWSTEELDMIEYAPMVLVGVSAGRLVEHIKKAYRDDGYKVYRDHLHPDRQANTILYASKTLQAVEIFLDSRDENPGCNLERVLEKNIAKLRAKHG